MKQKILMLLAVVLLSSASAFAQSGNSEPLKGDVNGDGMVDVADIAAIIDIMANGGGTVDGKQYWYLGVTDPSTFTIIGQIGDSNFDQWKEKSSPKNSISDDINFDLHTWYLAVPSNWNAIPYDYTGGASTVGVDWEPNPTTMNISGIEYTVWTSKGTTSNMNVCLHMENGVVAKKYVYAGQTNPLEEGFSFDNITHDGTSVIKQEVTTKVPVTISLTGPRAVWYIAVPNNLGYEMYDSSGTISAESSMDHTTKTIDGIEYKVYWTAVKTVALNHVVK